MLDEFIRRWNGKTLDYDGIFGGQCVDVTKQWAADNNRPVIKGNGIAWAGAPGYQWVAFLSGRRPNKGDIVVFNSPKVTGHVSIFIETEGSHFWSFDQNWPVGYPCQKVKHNWQNVIGWLKVGGTVTQHEKDFEKLYCIYQVLTTKAAPHANVEADLNHVEGIRLALIASGKSEVEADSLKWDQFFVERVKDFPDRFKNIGQRAGIL